MISFENVSLQFGERKLFNEVSFFVNAKDKIGLVGRNGAGKSTLLKVILGLTRIDKGNVVKSGDTSLGYLPQELSYKDSRSVIGETMTAFSDLHRLEKEIEHLNHELTERTDYETESYMDLAVLVAEKTERLSMVNPATSEASAVKTLKGLGFEDKDLHRQTREFSGGWRMRIELAKILLKMPDVFLLDEPTNHLDIESIQWLENFLRLYHGAVVLISHDKAFLDNVTQRTLEISMGRIYDYKVPYSKYVELRKERREQQQAAYRNQQKQIGDTEEFIERFRYKATKAVQVQSRIKQLAKIERIEIDDEDDSAINLRFPSAPRAGSIVFEAKGLSKRYGNHTVLNNIDIVVERGEKVAFVGRNGEGKTTLSRIIVNDLDYEGIIKPGHNVKIGYYAQNQEELLDREMTVLETIDRIAVGDVRTKIRDILGAFLFRGEEVDKRVKVLSGGEKSRLALARLLLEPYNLLVLDEPTNHLDMRSKDILKHAVKQYDGTVILVSHDREFLDGLTDRIYEFRDQKIKEFRGGVFEFLRKKKIESFDALSAGVAAEQGKHGVTKQVNEQKISYQERKDMDREIRKLTNELEKIESEIGVSEALLAEMDDLVANGNTATDQDFFGKYESLKKKVEVLLPGWERVQNELEKLKEKRNSVN
jgi:ATP-binding cassette subfamily F protein 3